MSDAIMTQEEINALINGIPKPSTLTEDDKDLLGEIGNISMGSASTALSTIVSKMVNITTPKVSVTTLREIKNSFEVPNVVLEVMYTEGLKGVNILLIKMPDAGVIADLMMGGDGSKHVDSLSELELSAVSEAMNQMIGTSATSLSTMLGVPINISPPRAMIWDNKSNDLSPTVAETDSIVRISFRLTIEELIDSEIMLLLMEDTAKAIIDKMSGKGYEEVYPQAEFEVEPIGSNSAANDKMPEAKQIHQASTPASTASQQETRPTVSEVTNVQKAQFAPLEDVSSGGKQNINLILDVPLQISVVLGTATKSIKEILELSNGSLVELDKLTEEPVEILVNGKKVALGEVVVIDEHFGVRIVSIVSNTEKVKSLQTK